MWSWRLGPDWLSRVAAPRGRGSTLGSSVLEELKPWRLLRLVGEVGQLTLGDPNTDQDLPRHSSTPPLASPAVALLRHVELRSRNLCKGACLPDQVGTVKPCSDGNGDMTQSGPRRLLTNAETRTPPPTTTGENSSGRKQLP